MSGGADVGGAPSLAQGAAPAAASGPNDGPLSASAAAFSGRRTASATTPDVPSHARVAASVSPRSARTFTLRTLRELIEDVYASKVKHDKKCAEARQPRETLVQHLSTYLHNRYGLRSLVHEYSQACFDAVRAYEAHDADVCTFGYALRNEVEEGFARVQAQLRHTVRRRRRAWDRSGPRPCRPTGHRTRAPAGPRDTARVLNAM